MNEVAVGDTLIIAGRNLAQSRIVKVERLTKTQIIVTGNNRYRRSDGWKVGRTDVWNSTKVTIPKEGQIEAIREAKQKDRLICEINGACQVNKLRAMDLKHLTEIWETI